MCKLSRQLPGRFQRLSGVEKRERSKYIEYTNNISFPEARKIIQSKNQFPARSYAHAATSHTDPKQHYSCQSCHSLLETLSKLTPDTLPKFINDLKVSLSEDKQSKPTVISTTQPTVKPKSSAPLREVAKQVAPPQTTQSPPSPVRQSTRSPNRGLRQSPTPRQRIRLEKTNSKRIKIDSPLWRMRSPWSVGHHHLPPHLPRLSTVGRALHRLLNLNGRNSINNHH